MAAKPRPLTKRQNELYLGAVETIRNRDNWKYPVIAAMLDNQRAVELLQVKCREQNATIALQRERLEILTPLAFSRQVLDAAED